VAPDPQDQEQSIQDAFSDLRLDNLLQAYLQDPVDEATLSIQSQTGIIPTTEAGSRLEIIKAQPRSTVAIGDIVMMRVVLSSLESVDTVGGDTNEVEETRLGIIARYNSSVNIVAVSVAGLHFASDGGCVVKLKVSASKVVTR